LRSRTWHGPEPHTLHRLLLVACRDPEAAAQAAWNRWLREGRFDTEDPASFELASLAVGRLGTLAGQGSEANRCRGWNRRAWFLSEIAVAAAGRLQETSQRMGLPLTAVGDIATHHAGLHLAGRPFPVRSLEFHLPGANSDDLRHLYAAAMQGPAGEAIRSRRLPLILHPNSRHPDTNTPAGRVVWLASRNWCRFPPGRVRWILELLATIESALDQPSLPRAIADEARSFGTLAAVAEALRWITAASVDGARLNPIVALLSTEPIPLVSRIRLWHARHQLGLGLRSRSARRLHPAG
jgi:hypothetical protein